MSKLKLSLLLSLISLQLSYAQEEGSAQGNQIKPFIAYELGEAAFNNFQSLSGEVGIRFPNDRMIRLTHMNVNLTEAHLSSSFAGAVEGNDVKGSLFGFEVFYDFPILVPGLYLGPSIGYYKNEYDHIVLNEGLSNKSMTLGVAVSYRETNIFKVKGLYFMFSLPIRTPFNPIEQTSLESTTIKNNSFDNNIWLFVGYEF